jgi:multiple sugar transport system permease protein
MRARLLAAGRFTLLGAWLVITVFPLYWVTVTSLKPKGEIFTFPLRYLPEHATLDNYRELFGFASFGRYLTNSLIVSLAAASVVLLVGLLAGYALARFSFRGRGEVMLAFLVTQMVPLFIALGPLYLLLSRMQLINRLAGLVLVYVAMLVPFCTVMLRGFFERTPVAIEEAAMIDGCSRLRALFTVVVPVMLPGIAATFVFAFIQCWNELFLAIMFIDDESAKTVPVAMNSFITQFDIDWGAMSAATVVSLLPTVVLFGYAQRYIVEGLSSGAVKG